MQELNMHGKQCPLPVIEAKKVLEKARQGEVISILVDNEIAAQNLQRLAKSRQEKVEVNRLAEDDFVVKITAVGTESREEGDVQEVIKKGTVVVISADRMGEPDEVLGKLLIKSFIFALSKQDILPGTILFYNGGARLTTGESDSLADLKDMEAQGVEILTCGMCLQHLGLEGQLKVGVISNMYDIVERMTRAEQVIRP